MPRFNEYGRLSTPTDRTRIETLYMSGWDGGWQPDRAEADLKPNELVHVFNMQFTEGYGLAKRKGPLKVSTDVTGDDEASHVIVMPVQTLDSNYPRFEQVVFYFNLDDGELYYQSLGEMVLEFESPAAGEDLIDSGHSIGDFRAGFNGPRPWGINAFTFGDKVYFVSQRTGGTSSNGGTLETQDGTSDGGSFAIVFDAQEWHDAGTVITRPNVHQLLGGTSGVPNARCALALYDRVFYANLHSYDAAQPTNDPTYDHRSRIYWTDAGTAETIQANSYVVVGSDDDGSDIVALVPFRESIIVLKIDSVWSLVGTNEDTFALYKISEATGTEGTHAAVADETHLYFFDSTRGVMQYDGVRFTNISEPINNTMLGELNRWSVFKTTMWLDDRRLYVSIPIGDIGTEDDDLPTKTYVYDFLLKVWSQWELGFAAGSAEYKMDTYLTPASAGAPDGEIYGGIHQGTKQGLMRYNAVDNDAGDAINGNFATAWFNPGSVGNKHRIRRLEVLAESLGDDVDLILYRNFSDTQFSSGTFTPTTGALGWHEQQGSHDGYWWSWLKMYFENVTDDETFQINGVGMSYSSRDLVRNDLGLTPAPEESGGEA